MKSASFSSASSSSTSSSAASPTMNSSGSFSSSSRATDNEPRAQPPSSMAPLANHATDELSSVSLSSNSNQRPTAATNDEGDSESYERNFWANIFDESAMVDTLLEDEAMDGVDETKPSAVPEHAPSSHLDGSEIDAAPSSALLDHWGHYDDSMADFSAPPSMAMPSSDSSVALYSQLGMYHAALGAGDANSDGSRFCSHAAFASNYAPPDRKLAAGTAAHTVTFDKQSNGAPFALSKPLVRDDGVLIVGTEGVGALTGGGAGHDQNRIFVTSINSPNPTQVAASILVEAEVRDLHWMNHQTAIAAIGKDIHLISVGAPGGNQLCHLQPAIPSVHSDAIRELAVQTSGSHILSGGFDETVVLTDLLRGGDPSASSIVTKFDAHDVVSSLRWSPDEAQISWTTDGGDFQVGDTRTRSPQLQIPLYTYLQVDVMGGLFTHEYLTAHKVVLGFESNHLVFLDIRMPRNSCCYAVSKSPMGTTGEIRRSRTNQFAVFGLGGFAKTALAHNSKGQEVLKTTQFNQSQSPAYKTSGDFSYDTNSFLAVSDNVLSRPGGRRLEEKAKRAVTLTRDTFYVLRRDSVGTVTFYGSHTAAVASSAAPATDAWKEERLV
ncbi:hypothetical protein PybrP1_004264 [[Pythium] brassicae (nom. inval.)]|nr:hypothetical protein PybrP1_004264 [[Pythium] brassicae (nom. inval.)]